MRRHQSSRARTSTAALLAAAALLCACRSTSPSEKEPRRSGIPGNHPTATNLATKPRPYDPRVWDAGTPESMGSLLAELDKAMRAWTNLTLTAQSQADKHSASKMQKWLMGQVHKRQAELVDELETGPPRNRAIAAGALGFSASKEVQGPLLVALGDADMDVVQNAALSLALLQQADTPMTPILEVMQDHPNGQARANAAYAVRNLIEAGAEPGENVVKAARHGLVDPEPFAQSQAALILAMAGDGESVAGIGELLASEDGLVVGAAMQALLALARNDSKLLGPTARAMVGGLVVVEQDLRPALLRNLVRLSGHNYGEDEKAWAEWAQRLP